MSEVEGDALVVADHFRQQRPRRNSGGVGLNTFFTFDNADRLTGMNHKYNGVSIRNYTWAFNNANELTQEVSYDGTVDYTYDNGSQLTGASGWRSETYSFDNTGNRTMTGYSTGTGNRMTSNGVFNYTYDNEGNMTKKTRISNGEYTDYTWDYRNRLTKVENRSSGGTLLDKSEYVYDLFDKRIATIVGVSSPVTTWTAYDGGNPYADYNGAGAIQNRYLAGRQLDQFFARFDASNSFIWYLTDHLGSVRDVANNTGTVLDHIKYDSFGGIVSESSPSNGDRFKFTGREYDATTGLYYYRARYYDPATGKFIAEDPLNLRAGDMNVYRYVNNAPSQLVDPTGKSPLVVGGGVAGGIIGGVGGGYVGYQVGYGLGGWSVGIAGGVVGGVVGAGTGAVAGAYAAARIPIQYVATHMTMMLGWGASYWQVYKDQSIAIAQQHLIRFQAMLPRIVEWHRVQMAAAEAAGRSAVMHPVIRQGLQQYRFFRDYVYEYGDWLREGPRVISNMTGYGKTPRLWQYLFELQRQHMIEEQRRLLLYMEQMEDLMH